MSKPTAGKLNVEAKTWTPNVAAKSWTPTPSPVAAPTAASTGAPAAAAVATDSNGANQQRNHQQVRNNNRNQGQQNGQGNNFHNNNINSTTNTNGVNQMQQQQQQAFLMQQQQQMMFQQQPYAYNSQMMYPTGAQPYYPPGDTRAMYGSMMPPNAPYGYNSTQGGVFPNIQGMQQYGQPEYPPYVQETNGTEQAGESNGPVPTEGGEATEENPAGTVIRDDWVRVEAVGSVIPGDSTKSVEADSAKEDSPILPTEQPRTAADEMETKKTVDPITAITATPATTDSVAASEDTSICTDTDITPAPTSPAAPAAEESGDGVKEAPATSTAPTTTSAEVESGTETEAKSGNSSAIKIYGKEMIISLFQKGQYVYDTILQYAEIAKEREPIGALPASFRCSNSGSNPNLFISTGEKGGYQNSPTRQNSGSRENLRGDFQRGGRGSGRGYKDNNEHGGYERNNNNNNSPAKYKSMFGVDKDKKDDDQSVREATLILNKLSVTKFEKLSNEFMEVVGAEATFSTTLLKRTVELIVSKAQMEEHFCFMYADLCRKITDQWASVPMPVVEKTAEAAEGEGDDAVTKTSSGDADTEGVATPVETETPSKTRGELFREFLLERCQSEFEVDRIAALEEIANDQTLEDEGRLAKELILKKRYTGHMRFIGEIYMKDLVKANIMNQCLAILIEDTEEEELMCMIKLFQTIGAKIEQYFLQKSRMKKTKDKKFQDVIPMYFRRIEEMSTKHPNSRVRFMLKDLIEMRTANWTARREEEKVEDLSVKVSDSNGSDNTGKGGSNAPTPVGAAQKTSGGPRDEWEVVTSTGRKKGATSAASTPKIASAPNSTKSNSNKFFPEDRRKGGIVAHSSSSSQLSNMGGVNGKSNTYQSKFNKTPTSGDARRQNQEAFSTSISKGPFVGKPAPVPESVTVDMVKDATHLEKTDIKRLKSVTEEYYTSEIMEEPYIVIKELIRPTLLQDAVKVLLASSVEKKQGDRVKLLALLVELHHHTGAVESLPSPYLSTEATTKGIYMFLEELSDLVIDAPMASTYGAFLVAGLIVNEVVSISLFASIPETEEQNFVEAGRPADFIAQVLSSIQEMKNTSVSQKIYEDSGVSISSFIRPMPRETVEQALGELADKYKLPFLAGPK